jgi:O-antigen ligase
VVTVAILGAALLIATPLLSPPTFAKLVVHFSDQMAHFGRSAYGLLYVRATVMSLDHPLIGLGFDGFRHGCYDALYQRGIPWLGISDAQAAGPAGCSIHPHNHYLEAATSGGIPGLLLFCAVVGSWLATLGRGLLRDPAAHRVALFTAVLIAVWPLASTSAFFTLPNAGWLFLLLGAGLAEARDRVQAALSQNAVAANVAP